jgi:predicted ATPase/class 3 adenylate cyclase
MSSLPTGTLTLLFTDIEGSTRLLQRIGASEYARSLGRHHQVMRAAIADCAGVEVKTEGDSFFVVFRRPADAVRAAVDAQRSLAAQKWPDGVSLDVRMGIHTGALEMSEGEYVGLDIHRAARIAAAAHGGQVVVSDATRALVSESLPAGVALADLGEHMLKDLDAPEHLWQLTIDGLRSEFPPIRAISMRLQVLPAETTTFVGRQRDLDRARELLRETRLLTLTGPGGTGKTRLALQLARSVDPEFADGTAFVVLAPISNPELVMPTVRGTLGLSEQTGQTSLETVVERLRDRQALLVLDNFEQVLPAASSVADLLAATENLKLIATSRSPLHLAGEQEFQVPPLEVPTVEQASDLEALSHSDAVALFLQRARAVRPDFELNPSNARAIVEICARLDGLPLAIELAASRVKLLPPQALLQRLENRLDLLQSASVDRTDRQRTLRGTIDWSYELLDEAEGALFRRLAVFVGGWRLEDAEAIVPAAGDLGLDVLEGHARLIDHSLLRQLETGGGEPRFSMLETIREYGLERLAATDELLAMAEAHARHFAGLARDAEPHLTTDAVWPDRLELEQDNMRAALGWLADNDLVLGLETSGRLWRFWHLRGHLREGRRLLSDMLARQRPDGTAALGARAKALIGLAGIVYWQLDYETARRSYEEALDISRSIRDPALEVEILYSLAYVRAIERDWDGALVAYGEAQSIYQEQGNSLGVAWAKMGRGMVGTLRGEHEGALPILEEAQAEFAKLNDSYGVRNTISVKERALLQLGRLDEVRRVNLDFIRLSHDEQDPTALSSALLDAASIAALDGEFERAARLLGAGQRVVDESGGQPPPELVNRIEPLPILREHLPEATLTRLVSEGHGMARPDAVRYALSAAPTSAEDGG